MDIEPKISASKSSPEAFRGEEATMQRRAKNRTVRAMLKLSGNSHIEKKWRTAPSSDNHRSLITLRR